MIDHRVIEYIAQALPNWLDTAGVAEDSPQVDMNCPLPREQWQAVAEISDVAGANTDFCRSCLQSRTSRLAATYAQIIQKNDRNSQQVAYLVGLSAKVLSGRKDLHSRPLAILPTSNVIRLDGQ
jgi:hypothetical protein